MINRSKMKTYSRKNSSYLKRAFVSINFNEICRFCLSEMNLNLIPILQGSGNSKVCYQEWIKYILDVEVEEGDGMPPNSCENCLSLVELTYFFKKKCETSESKLREHLRLKEINYMNRFFEMGFIDLEEEQRLFRRHEPSQSDCDESSAIDPGGSSQDPLINGNTYVSNYSWMSDEGGGGADEDECTFDVTNMPKRNKLTDKFHIFNSKITKDTEQQTEDIPQEVEKSCEVINEGSQGKASKFTRYNLRKRKRATHDDNEDDNMSVVRVVPLEKKDESVQFPENTDENMSVFQVAPLEKKDESVQVPENTGGTLFDGTQVFDVVSFERMDESGPIGENSDQPMLVSDIVPHVRNDERGSILENTEGITPVFEIVTLEDDESGPIQENSHLEMSVSDIVPHGRNDERGSILENTGGITPVFEIVTLEDDDDGAPIPENVNEGMPLFDVVSFERNDERGPILENSDEDMPLFRIVSLEGNDESDPVLDNSDEDMSSFDVVPLERLDENGSILENPNENMSVFRIVSLKKRIEDVPVLESPDGAVSVFKIVSLEGSDESGPIQENSIENMSLCEIVPLKRNDEGVSVPENSADAIENEATCSKTLIDGSNTTLQKVNDHQNDDESLRDVEYNEDSAIQPTANTNDTNQFDDLNKSDQLNHLNGDNNTCDTMSTISTTSTNPMKNIAKTIVVMKSIKAIAINDSNGQNLGVIIHPFEINRIYESKSNVEVVETVPAESLYRCCTCPLTYPNLTELRNHLKSVHKIFDSCSCEVCYKTFTCINSLRRHMLIHTGRRPYKCHICDKAFSQSTTLNRHIATHKDLKPFNCHFCGKGYTQKMNLISHLKIHGLATNAMMFRCNACNKAFAHQSGLSRHQKEHKGFRFMCNLCKKSFVDPSAQQRHVKRMHAKRTATILRPRTRT